MSFLRKSFVFVSLVNTKGFVYYLPREVLQVFIIFYNSLRRGNPFPGSNIHKNTPSEEHCEVFHTEVLVQEFSFPD